MTHEEMERTLVGLAALQEKSQQLLHQTLQAMGKLNGLVVDFSEHTQTSINRLVDLAERTQTTIDRLETSIDRLEVRIEQFAEQQNNSLLRLEGLIEAFIRGSQNGGKQT